MKTTKDVFLKLFSLRREDNSWDYKKEIHISTKLEKYNLIKDFLAFSNFGGGYILLGVDEFDYSLNSVELIDSASIGNILETNLGFNIEFELSYFKLLQDDEELNVGLIYIYPSVKILTNPKLMQVENQKVIIGINDILTRRNTKSTKANTQDIEDISERVQGIKSDRYNQRINDVKPYIYLDDKQELDDLWNNIDNKFELNAEQVAIKIRYLLFYSKHSKFDFAKLAGIEMGKFEQILEGILMPELDLILRISMLTTADLSFFFQLTYRGMKPFWKDDLVRHSIFKLINPVKSINILKDKDKFLGHVVYQTAKNIVNFSKFIKNKSIDTSWYPEYKPIVKSINEISEIDTDILMGQSRHQHYKLLEQVKDIELSKGFTIYETMVRQWFFCSSEYLVRIFTEAIKEINIIDGDNFIIKFHFWDEIIKREIKGRDYDSENMRINFTEIKIKI